MPASQKIKASTQEHLDIEDITEDLVILKSGWVAMVMSTTAVNFDILSEAEQDATIYAYSALLNSLSFPVQILIRSKKADITAYYQQLEEALQNQLNPDLKRQIQKYMDFVTSTVQQKTVLDKSFYLIINFSPLELGIKAIKRRTPTKTQNKALLIRDAQIALSPKRDHLIKQTARLGLTTKQLTIKELIELFYDIYNPAPTGTQRVILDTGTYTTPLVEPAVEVPTPAPTQPPQKTPEPSPVAETIVSQPPQVATASQSILSDQPVNQPSVTPPQPTSPPSSTQLRPVPEQNPTPAPPPTTVPPPLHTEALKDLQEATIKAQELINQQATAVNQPVISNLTDQKYDV